MLVFFVKMMVNVIVLRVVIIVYVLWDFMVISVRKVRNFINVDDKLMDI